MREAVVVFDMTRDSIAPEARAVVHVRSARRRTDKWFLKFWELANEIWQPGQQKWSLEYIAAMAKSKIVRSDELMR
jgi:hypothetical protein